MGRVLIVEDAEDMRFVLADIIRKEGYGVFTAASGNEALDILAGQIVDIVFLDIGLPDTDGISLIGPIKDITPDVDIIMLTADNDAKSAVNALKAGAIDYILKPFDIIELKHVLNRSMQCRFQAKKVQLASGSVSVDGIVGNSPAIIRLKDEIKTAADVRAPVLITGETGTGKELVARAIHNSPNKKNGIFVKVDCGTLQASLIESELFGYEKGAFTDAKRDRKGLVEMADGGTLFLDEIGNLPLELQPLLLRLIEESTFRRVGGLTDIQVSVRIVAATNINMQEQLAEGSFREDLFYRLNVINIPLPPLRDRGNDILTLAQHFLAVFNREMKRELKGFTDDAEQVIKNHSWPGNIRELKNLVERAVIYAKNDWIDTSRLGLAKLSPGKSPTAQLISLEEAQKRHVKMVLRKVKDNKSKAARILQISRTTLREKLK